MARWLEGTARAVCSFPCSGGARLTFCQHTCTAQDRKAGKGPHIYFWMLLSLVPRCAGPATPTVTTHLLALRLLHC